MKIRFISLIIFFSFTFSNQAIIDSLLSSLSLKEKIAQMIMVRVRSDYYSSDNANKKQIERWIKDNKVGGLITFDGNGNVHGMFNNHKYFQSISNIPLLIASDLERGAGQQMAGATLFPTNMAIAATGNKNNAYLQGKITANEAKVLGIHMILAPVMDVNNNPNNPIINFRSYSDSPTVVSDYGLEFIRGIQENGLYACAKHFPGHGNTSIDSHSSLPYINSSVEELNEIELRPFKNAVLNDVKMIMTGHISMPNLDESLSPASHSKKMTTNLLKKQWKFEGLVITDGMEMTGITNEAWSGESAIRAINAGNDIILLPLDVEKTIIHLEKAVLNGRISEEKINNSVEKIIKSKFDLNLFEFIFDEENLKRTVAKNENLNIANRIANESITLVKDEKSNLPIKVEEINSPIHLIISTDDNANGVLKTFRNNLKYTYDGLEELFINYETTDLLNKQILDELKNHDQIIISSLVKIRMNKGESTVNSSHLKLIKLINDLNIPNILISFGSPYLDDYTISDTYMVTYGYGYVTQKAAAAALFGRINIDGKLPINLNEYFKRGHGMKIKKHSTVFNTIKKVDLSKSWDIINSAIDDKIFPGAQIMIIKDNEILADKSFGNFTYDKKSKAVNHTSIYDIASITKVVATTSVIMKLVEKKIINLNHNINQFYPDFKGKWKDEVKIKHLLNHSSGLNSYKQYFKDENFSNTNDIVDDIVRQDLLFKPGTKSLYSDLGMIILKDIAEIVTESSFEKLVNDWIIKPLKLKNTFFNPNEKFLNDVVPTEIDNNFRDKMIKGIVHDENAYIMGGVSGHAGLFSNARDLGIFSQLIMNEGVYNGKRFFKRNTINLFTKKNNNILKSDFAYGWDTPSKNGKSNAGDFFSNYSFGHLGFTGTSLWIDAQKKIIIILLTNRTYPNRDKSNIYLLRRNFHNQVMSALRDI